MAEPWRIRQIGETRGRDQQQESVGGGLTPTPVEHSLTGGVSCIDYLN